MNLGQLSKAVGVKLTVRNRDELIDATIDKLAPKLNKRRALKVELTDHQHAVDKMYQRGNKFD